ncbi:MAG: DNA cytosine methyltransferase [Clostridium sp.]|uniref:DNA cytosine methyltransferase n=1 Tax=Clostridium sp. TaxID=1506 RepID=UPI0028FDD0C2|nr:DNA cytosine methyltransferase [Clostridium sp.]MDU1230851.1 DNA cytosine methyltransferase [Clostridium sp.]
MLNVIDLFCGCGGLSLGFKLAGYNIVGGVDLNKDAIETFNYNFNNAKGICCDLLEMGTDEIIKKFGDLKNIDVIIGGPPCQGFSSANRHKKEEEDDRNKLFFEFVKFVDLAEPKAIVIENVRGIVTSNNGYAKNRIYEIFEQRGYKVSHKILDASEYGVPQKRLRNFFVMTKNEEFDFESLKKTENIVTVKEALSELYNFDNEINEEAYSINKKPLTEYQKYLRREDNKIYNHEIKYPADIVQKRISCVPQGGNWQNIPENLFENNRKNRHSSAYKRLNESDTSVTIDTGNAHSNYFHPLYNRIPTVREAARIQSFNDKFVFKGSRTAQYRQVGNAVPPLLSKAIADALKEIITDEEK